MSDTTITAETIRSVPIVAVREAFRYCRRFGEVPSNVSPEVAAWYWAFYEGLGVNDQQARERAIVELRDLRPEVLLRAPKVNERGGLIDYPSSKETYSREWEDEEDERDRQRAAELARYDTSDGV